MNTLSRASATILLMSVAQLAVAQTEPTPPPDAPRAEPSVEQQPEGPQGSGDVGKEIGHAVDAIHSFSVERRAEAIANARRAADDLDRQMERLQQQTDQGWSRMSQAARDRSQATMADLRKRRNALAEWVGGLRHGSVAAWGEVRDGFIGSYHELADAIRDAGTSPGSKGEEKEDNADSRDEDRAREPESEPESDGRP